MGNFPLGFTRPELIRLARKDLVATSNFQHDAQSFPARVGDFSPMRLHSQVARIATGCARHMRRPGRELAHCQLRAVGQQILPFLNTERLPRFS
jgi:hypothetical protein